jgi:plastocyanin
VFGLVRWACLTPAPVCRLAALAALVFATACGGGDGPTEPPGPPAQLVKSDGDQQAWYFDNPLPAPYRVSVLDADGRAVPGVTVSWEVTSGGGSVDSLESQTGSDGVASATHTLGTGTSYTVVASVTGLPDVAFSASASSPPTSGAVTVGNDVFSPRDVAVKVNGTVTWTWNPGGRAHNVIYVTGPIPRPADSPTQDNGTHSQTFTALAVYRYICNIHAGMEGTVSVVN